MLLIPAPTSGEMVYDYLILMYETTIFEGSIMRSAAERVDQVIAWLVVSRTIMLIRKLPAPL
jgi:hypothetical protein